MQPKKTITFEPKNTNELSRFLKTNRSEYHEVLIVLTKKKNANPQPVSFAEALTEAKKHGLIDSRTKSMNEKKYCIRFTKRKAQSHQIKANQKTSEEIQERKEAL